MTIAIGILFLFNILKVDNENIQKHTKAIGWTLVVLGLPEYILSIINLIGRLS